MTISLLKNTDAFLLMLRLLICSISRPLQASFVHYVYQFCELQPSDWTAEWQDQVQKVLLQQRRSHRCRRYMQVNVECHPPRKLKPRLAPSSFSRLRTISSRTPSRTPSPSLSVLSLLDQIKLDLKSKKIITPSQPTLLKSSKTDRSKQLVAVLARSIRRMNEAQRHRHRSTVAHKFIGRHGKSEASIIAGELFLQQFLALRKSQKSLFVLSVNGGLLPNFCSIQPKQRKMLHVPVPIMPHNRTRVALYFTLRRIDHQSICFRWKVVGRFKIDLKKVHVLHGIKFRLVSTLGDRYMLLCDSGSIDRAAPKAKMDSERSESMSNEKSQSQSQTSVTGRNNRRESTSRLHQSKTEDSTDASEHSSVSSKLIEKHFRPSFEVHVEWEASNPYDRQLQSKRELADKYVKSLHDHVRLIKYVLVRRLRQSPLIKHGETLDRLLGPARFRRLLGWRLHWMLTEHAFQCGLTAADHGLCIQATIADVRLLRQEFIKGEAKRIDVQPDTDHPTFTLSRNETTKSWFTIGASYFSMEQDHRSVGEYPSSDLDRMAEQRSVGNLSTASSNPLADQARIAERGTKTVQRVTDQTVGQVEQLLDQNQVNTAFWTDTIERAHAWLQHTGDVRPLEQLSHRRLLQWNLIGLGWADQRSQRLQLFDRDSMVGRYLDDFDLASQSVAVLVCKSFGRHPRFVRLNLRPSLSLFSLDNPARQLAIAIVCNRYYQLMMLVITFHQLWIIYPNLKLSQLRSRYGFYIVFFSVDLALQILAKGLWLHSYAYLTNLTNVLQTVFCIVTWFFLFRLQSLDPKLLDKTDFNQDLMQMPGLMQFLIILQCLRLIRGVSRSKVFESLRLFVKVIGTLLPQLFPVAILWMATLLYSTELTHRLFPRLFRQLCVPRWRTQQLEQLAATIEVNDSEYGSSYERMEEAYTRINYNNSLYLFAYRSCGVHRENYLSDTCDNVNECHEMSNQFQHLIGRLPSDLLTFERFSTTSLILAMAMFNQNFDPYFYRMVRSGGLLAFIIGASLYMFGFLLLSLVLSMIYDTYQKHMARMHVFRPNQHQYYAGESEFTFDARNTSVCTRAALMQPLEQRILRVWRHKQRPAVLPDHVLSVDATLDKTKTITSRDTIEFNYAGIPMITRPPCQPFDSRLMHEMQLTQRGLHETVLTDAAAVAGAIDRKKETIDKPKGKSSSLLRVKSNSSYRRSVFAMFPDWSLKTLGQANQIRINKPDEKEVDQMNVLEPKLRQALGNLLSNRDLFAPNWVIRFQWWIRMLANDSLQQLVTSRYFTFFIDMLIIIKLVLFITEIQFRTWIRSSDEQDRFCQSSETAYRLVSSIYVWEFALRLIAGRGRTLRNAMFRFEAITVFFDWLLVKFTDVHTQPFSNLRVWRLLYQRWPLLQLLSKAIKASKLELTSNLALFTVVFIFFTLFAARFFNDFQVESESEDFLRLEMDFSSTERSARTVYLTIVTFVWSEIVSQYLLFNFEYAPGRYLFHQISRNSARPYVDLLPYAFIGFISICIGYSLFFRNLFIPQVFHYLDVGQVLGIKQLEQIQFDAPNRSLQDLIETRNRFVAPVAAQARFRLVRRVWRAFKAYLLSPILYGHQSIGAELNTIDRFIRSKLLWINLIAVFSIIYFQWPFVHDFHYKPMESTDLNLLMFLVSYLAHSLLIINFVLRLVQKGVLLFVFGVGSKVPMWRIVNTSIDLITLIASFKYILFQVKNRSLYQPAIHTLSNLALASVLRLLRLFSRTRRWAKGLCTVWIGVVNSVALCALVVFTLAAIGTSFFFQCWNYCSLVQAGWFPQKSRRIALGPPDHLSLCVEEPWKADFWLQHGLSVLTQRTHTFNMENLWQAAYFVVHALFGSDLFSSVELLTSYDITTGRMRKQVRDSSWLFIVPLTMFGLLFDAFIFSVIARQMAAVGNFAGRSVIHMIQNRPALGTLLALDGLNYSEPWRNPLLGCATKFGRFLHRLVNNRTYRLIQFLLLLGNLPINMIAVRSLSIEHSQWVDVGLLLNSLADGLLRVAVVGSELLFRYPALFIHDIVLPMLLCTFHLSGLRFGRQMRWSLLLPLRVLTLPDRYLSAVGAQGPRTLLRTLMAAKRQLATVFALLLSFLFLASAMSVRQWTLNEQMGHVFEPPELPVTFNSVMFTLAHLYSVVFTGSFDVATQAFRERSSFCGVSDPHLSLSQHVEALIRDAIDRSPPTVVWIDRNQSNVYPLNVSSAQWLIQKGEVSDWLHSPDYRLPFISPIPPALWTYIDSLSPIPLFFCAIDIRTPTVSLVFSSQLFELVRRIQYRCVALQQQSTNSYKKLENCNLNGTTVQRNLFFVRLNQIFQELLTDHHGRLQQYLKIKNNPAETPESVNKLQVIESLCNYERLYANSSRDPSRFDSQALLDQLVDRYLYTSLHHAFQMQRDRNTLQRYDLNAGMCANPKWILIFYVLVFAIGRLLILNMFRAVVLNRYELERLRQTNAIRPIDVEAFLNSWKRYCVSIRSRSQTVADSNRLDSKMMDSGGWTETAKPSTIDPSRSSIYDAVVARVLQLQAQLKRTSDGTASQLSPATDSKDWPSSGVGLPNTDPDTFELNQNVPRDGGLGSGGSGGPGSERVGFTATTPDATESSARPQTTSEPASGTSTVESLYLPIRYALLFLREMAPLKFRLSACSEESALCILGRYALRVRESDMTVHGFDLLAVCCAHRLNCSPQMFQAHFRHMLQTLADTINRHCPDYDFDECQFITMPAYLNGFYFGKLLLNSVLQQKVLHHFSISRNPSTSNE